MNSLYDKKFHYVLTEKYLKNTRWTKLRMAQVLRMVKPKKGDKILDLGCSTGATTHFCSKYGADTNGVDSSQIAIDEAKKLFKNNLTHFYKMDISDLNGFRDNHFDKAVGVDIIEHLDDTTFKKMLKEVFRVLKRGGTLSIYTPNPKHIIERLKKRNLIIKQNPTHIGLRAMEEIKSILEEKRFKIEMAYHTESFIPVFNIIERVLKPVPLIGDLFKYRICVMVKKP